MTTHAPAYYRDLLRRLQLVETVGDLPQWFQRAWAADHVNFNRRSDITYMDCRVAINTPWCSLIDVSFLMTDDVKDYDNLNARHFYLEARTDDLTLPFARQNLPHYRKIIADCFQVTVTPDDLLLDSGGYRWIDLRINTQTLQNELKAPLLPFAEYLHHWAEAAIQ